MKTIRSFSLMLILLSLTVQALGESGSVLIHAGQGSASDDLSIYTAAAANGIVGACDMTDYTYLFF